MKYLKIPKAKFDHLIRAVNTAQKALAANRPKLNKDKKARLTKTAGVWTLNWYEDTVVKGKVPMFHSFSYEDRKTAIDAAGAFGIKNVIETDQGDKVTVLADNGFNEIPGQIDQSDIEPDPKDAYLTFVTEDGEQKVHVTINDTYAGSYEDIEEAEEAAIYWMDKNGLYPPMWQISESGEINPHEIE